MTIIDTIRGSRRSSLAALMLAVLLGSACADDLVVPDFNNPELDDLENDPTRAAVIAASQGLLIGSRNGMAAPNGYVSLLGIIGRESYNFDGADPRFITEMLINPLSAGSPAFGANLWTQRYLNMRNGYTVLNALDGVPDGDLPPADKDGIRGFAKTIMAHDLLLVVNTRDINGAVVDVNRPVPAEPAPIVSKDAALDEVVRLLDEGLSDLQQAGAEFVFALSSGFDGFDTPSTFAQVNRALAARVAAYREEYGQALTALSASFVSTAAPLDLGVYHIYSTGSGDTQNGIAASPDIFAHPALWTDAELKANDELDDRVTAKLERIDEETQLNVVTDVGFLMYGSLSAPIPIIRNEELILLRAEANLMTGDPDAAAADINFIRVNSGGLEPIDDLADRPESEILDELLRQRRYSLLFEGGHRWIDMRRFDRLDELPLAGPSHQVHSRFPIPEAECLAQADPPAGVCED